MTNTSVTPRFLESFRVPWTVAGRYRTGRCSYPPRGWSFSERSRSSAANKPLVRRIRSWRPWTQVDGPKNLWQATKVDHIARLLARAIGREAAMIGRVPILRGNDQIEVPLNGIGDWNHFFPSRHCESAAWQKVVLQIDEQ